MSRSVGLGRNNVGSNTKSLERFSFSNPMVRKIARCQETSEEHVTYRGIGIKVLFFMLTVIIGSALCFVALNIGQRIGVEDVDAEKFTIYLSKLTDISVILLLVTFVLFILMPILCAFIRKAIPVMGTLYCISAGYIVTFLASVFEEYRSPVLIALVLTIALFIGLAALYSTGKIKVSQKFRTGVFGVVIASLISSVVLVIFSFIPALRFIPQFFVGNSVFGIIFAIIGLIIACCFVIVDFSTIQGAVDNKLPANYEWYCAFALAFSFIYLYFKILELILKILASSKK